MSALMDLTSNSSNFVLDFLHGKPWEKVMARIQRPVAQIKPVREDGITQEAMAVAGLRAFFNIARVWNLGVDEQLILLGAPGRSTLFKWRANPETARVPRDTLERLSYIVGIYKSLQILLPVHEAADGWIRKPNAAPLANGGSALDRMLGGNVSDLVAVRQYLDAVRGGWA